MSRKRHRLEEIIENPHSSYGKRAMFWVSGLWVLVTVPLREFLGKTLSCP